MVLTELQLADAIIPPCLNVACMEDKTYAFQRAPFKFAVQKNGELTEISLQTINRLFDIDTGEVFGADNRSLFTVKENGTGIAFVRNRDICQLVASGSVDAALVGLDQIYESGCRESLEILRKFPELGQWDIVLATPNKLTTGNVFDLLLVATQYPVIAQAFFEHVGHSRVKILQSQGSTEILPLLTHRGQQIDGIVDLRVSGKTLQANGLIAWDPVITKVYPLLIANREALCSPVKKPYLDKLVIN